MLVLQNIIKNIEKKKLIVYILYMGCSNCKKKTAIKRNTMKKNINTAVKQNINNTNKTPKRNIIDIDKTAMWIIIIWFLLGAYGLYSLIKNLIGILS